MPRELLEIVGEEGRRVRARQFRPSGTSSSSLDRVILAAPQVGPGYRAHVIQDGRSVQGQVTLDLCGFTFASEALRVARLQVAYYKPGHAPVLSNEVVTYKLGGTTAAIQQLREAIRECPRKPVVAASTGICTISRLTSCPLQFDQGDGS